MPHEKSSDLFVLIKSLSLAEKRYFSSFASRRSMGEENNYLKLFNAIDEQEVYNEKQIVKKLEKEKFVKQLHRTKNYLYELILSSLGSFHSSKNINSELRRKCDHIETLIDKGLFKQAAKLIKQTKKDAVLNEKYYTILHVNQLEMNLLKVGVYTGNQNRHYEKLRELETDSIEKLQQQVKYRAAKDEVFLMVRQLGTARSKEAIKKIDTIISDELFQNENLAVTYLSKVYLYQMQSIAYTGKGDHKTAHHYTQKLLRLLEGTSIKNIGKLDDYVTITGNYMIECRQMSLFNEMLKSSRKLRNYGLRHPKLIDTAIEARIFDISYQNELAAYIKLGLFKNGSAIVPKIKKGLKQYDEQLLMPDKLTFYYGLSYLYFGLENYSEAMMWMNKVMNEWIPDFELNLYATVKLLNIIIHFEMGNLYHLEYVIRSTYRFLLKQNRLFVFEKAILTYFKALPRISSKTEHLKVLEELSNSLKALPEDELKKGPFEYFDFISWIDSKIQKRPFAEIVKEKAN